MSLITFDYINLGTTPNDGTGDTIRSAFQTVNNNTDKLLNILTGQASFSNVSALVTNTGTIYTNSITVSNVIYYPVNAQYTVGTTQVIDFNAGDEIFKANISQDITFAYTNVKPGRQTVMILQNQDSTFHHITMPNSLTTSGLQLLTIPANQIAIMEFYVMGYTNNDVYVKVTGFV